MGKKNRPVTGRVVTQARQPMIEHLEHSRRSSVGGQKNTLASMDRMLEKALREFFKGLRGMMKGIF